MQNRPIAADILLGLLYKLAGNIIYKSSMRDRSRPQNFENRLISAAFKLEPLTSFKE